MVFHIDNLPGFLVFDQDKIRLLRVRSVDSALERIGNETAQPSSPSPAANAEWALWERGMLSTLRVESTSWKSS